MKQAIVEAEQADYQTGSRIVSVEARTIRVPLDRHTAFATRLVTARDYTVVRVTTADGSEFVLVDTAKGTRAPAFDLTASRSAIFSNEKIRWVRDSIFTARIAASSYSSARNSAANSSRLRRAFQLRCASTL